MSAWATKLLSKRSPGDSNNAFFMFVRRLARPRPYSHNRTRLVGSSDGRASQPFPYTGKAAPLMAREASDARNVITSAIAAGSTHLLKSPFGTAARFCGVSIVPGMMQLTLMFDAFSSAARDSVNRSTALFDAL